MSIITEDMVINNCWWTVINHGGNQLQYNTHTGFYKVIKNNIVKEFYLLDDALFFINNYNE